MIKAVIFDCFGVLVGTGYWNTFKRAGGKVKDKPAVDELLHKANLNLITNDELHRETSKLLGISQDTWEEFVQKDERPNPELFEFIRNALKDKYELAIISNAGAGTLERKLPPDFLDLFTVKVTSGEVGLVKPNPEIFQLACNRLEIEPNEAIFIDDNQNLLKGAELIGMETIFFRDSGQTIADIQRLLSA